MPDVKPGQCRVCVEREISYVGYTASAIATHDRLRDHPFDGEPRPPLNLDDPEFVGFVCRTEDLDAAYNGRVGEGGEQQ